MSAIEWTDVKSGEDRFPLNAACEHEALVGHRINLGKETDPRIRVAGPLPAVAAPASADQVVRRGRATCRHRDDMVKAGRIPPAVRAGRRQDLLSPPTRYPAHSSAGRSASSVGVCPVVAAFGFSGVANAQPTSDLSRGMPPTALSAPSKTHREHGASLVDAGPIAGGGSAPASQTTGRQAITSGPVPTERCNRFPAATSVAPFLTGLTVRTPLGDGNPEPASGHLLDPRPAAHGPHSLTEVRHGHVH